MNKTTLVAGVGPGLGMALVSAFAARGDRVVALARRRERVQGMVQRRGLSGQVVVRSVDLSRQQQIHEAIDDLERTGSVIDVAIYNAGLYATGRVLEVDPSTVLQGFEVGCMGALYLAQRLGPGMVERGQGTLLFTGATASLRGSAGFAAVSTYKAALRMLSQSLARELGPLGVHVAHVVIDGAILAAGMDDSDDRFLSPSDIAAEYLRLDEQPRSAWTQESDLRPWKESF